MALGRSFSNLMVVAPAAAFGVFTGVDFVVIVDSSGVVGCDFVCSVSSFLMSLPVGDFKPEINQKKSKQLIIVLFIFAPKGAKVRFRFVFCVISPT